MKYLFSCTLVLLMGRAFAQQDNCQWPWAHKFNLSLEGTQVKLKDGDTVAVWTVVNHQLEGAMIHYYRDHSIRSQAHFSNGCMTGQACYYRKDGFLYLKEIYAGDVSPVEITTYKRDGRSRKSILTGFQKGGAPKYRITRSRTI